VYVCVLRLIDQLIDFIFGRKQVSYMAVRKKSIKQKSISGKEHTCIKKELE